MSILILSIALGILGYQIHGIIGMSVALIISWLLNKLD